MPRKKPEVPATPPARKPRKRAPKLPKAKGTINNEHVPTPQFRAQVELAAGFGLPHKQIAVLIGLGSDHTLRRHYTTELERGEAMAVFKVAGTLFKQATREKDPSLAAAIFFLKCKGGFREKVPLDDPNVRQSLAELIALSGLSTAGDVPAADQPEEAVKH